MSGEEITRLRIAPAPLVWLRGGPAAGTSIRWPREVLRFTLEGGGGHYALAEPLLAGVESTVATWWPDLLTGERFPVDPACPSRVPGADRRWTAFRRGIVEGRLTPPHPGEDA